MNHCDALFPICAEKSRVYLGVRVKLTVKELLQRHRAQEANKKKLKTAYLEMKDLCATTFPRRHVDPPPAAPETDAGSCGTRALQLRTSPFPVPGSSGCVQMQASSFSGIHQPFGDGTLPSDGYNAINRGAAQYHAPLPPLPASSPLPWCSGADFHGHGMAVSSSSESLTISRPMDHNSYSPQGSISSSSSSCYDSPTRMDSGYCAPPSDYFPHQHYNTQQDYVPGCWFGQQESIPALDDTPYYSPTDYPYTCSVEENYFRKDIALSSEMCYDNL
ncbi:colorectal cancer associated 2 isoform 1-T1 [Menidia menidia]